MVGRSFSRVRLDADWVRRDASGRSVAYFCLREPSTVGRDLIQDLKSESVALGGENIRLCLHSHPDAAYHQMIIVEYRDKYYPPHKHLQKGDSWHVIEGTLGVFVFEDDGEIADTIRLESEGDLIGRVGIGVYHAVFPLTDYVVYHESKPGPFLGPNDSVLPDWAPDWHSQPEIEAYKNRLTTFMD